jgi:hypothetical protein
MATDPDQAKPGSLLWRTCTRLEGARDETVAYAERARQIQVVSILSP